jgi:integrase
VRRELSGEIQPIVTFACETGCRKSEIMGLRWSQVDLAERLIRLEPGETKNDGGRTIFPTPDLWESLAIQKAIRDQ